MKFINNTHQRAFKYYLLGLSNKEIGTLLNRSPRTVENWLQGFKKQLQHTPKETQKKAHQLHKKGVSLVDIAKIFNRTPQTIRKWIDKINLTSVEK